MKIIVGLGNPGIQYETTRHNVGFLAVDRLIDSWRATGPTIKHQAEIYSAKVDGEPVMILKPQTFMNDSGVAIKALVNFFKIKPQEIYVIHDDLDIPLGKWKLQKGVGPKVHNGINSIENELGTQEFWRIRIGIDNRDSENRIAGEEYVLQKFLSDENHILENVSKESIDTINQIVEDKKKE
jgi:PTH1 family peptidyl-tRNA hydrolase